MLPRGSSLPDLHELQSQHESPVAIAAACASEAAGAWVGQRGPTPTVLRCQVKECGELLDDSAKYYKRFRICRHHASLPEMQIDGKTSRFCQQCGRFEDITNFEADRRSCRVSLEKHNARRRRRHLAASAHLSSTSAAAGAAFRPMVRAATMPAPRAAPAAVALAPRRGVAAGLREQLQGQESAQQWPSSSVPGGLQAMTADAQAPSQATQPSTPLAAAMPTPFVAFSQQQVLDEDESAALPVTLLPHPQACQLSLHPSGSITQAVGQHNGTQLQQQPQQQQEGAWAMLGGMMLPPALGPAEQLRKLEQLRALQQLRALCPLGAPSAKQPQPAPQQQPLGPQPTQTPLLPTVAGSLVPAAADPAVSPTVGMQLGYASPVASTGSVPTVQLPAPPFKPGAAAAPSTTACMPVRPAAAPVYRQPAAPTMPMQPAADPVTVHQLASPGFREDLERVSLQLFEVPSSALGPHVREGVISLMRMDPTFASRVAPRMPQPMATSWSCPAPGPLVGLSGRLDPPSLPHQHSCQPWDGLQPVPAASATGWGGLPQGPSASSCGFSNFDLASLDLDKLIADLEQTA